MQNKPLDERCGRGDHSWPSDTGDYSVGEFKLELFLEEIRDAIKLSQWKTYDRFALAHGYSHSAFSNKLNGKSDFSLYDAIRLCKELGLSLNLYRYMR